MNDQRPIDSQPNDRKRIKTFVAILIILCLLLWIGSCYWSRQRATPPLAPAIEPVPVQTNQPPAILVSEIVSNPPPTVTNEVSDIKVETTTNPSAPVVPEPVVVTNSPPPVLATNTFANNPVKPVESIDTLATRDNSGFTNRFALSARFGLNLSGKFKGVGSSFTSGTPLSANRRTPNGDAYNYDNGYVLTDISGNAGGQSWYWGYDNASQVNSGANTIAFNHTVATGLPSQNAGDDSTSVGAELTYDRELGVREDWHHLRYGLEGAFNYMPIEFKSGGAFNAALAQRTDTYSYTSGTTPPPAPYQGSFGGPGFVINVPSVSSTTVLIPGATFIAQQHFDANLWGLRFGPYVEYPVTQKLDLFLTGGLALGLIDGNASWKETLMLPGGAGSLTASGSGSDISLLYGYYIGLSAGYQLTERWGVEAGLQFQDLGTYDHNFGGRTAELDLSKSLFIHAGISYSF